LRSSRIVASHSLFQKLNCLSLRNTTPLSDTRLFVHSNSRRTRPRTIGTVTLDGRALPRATEAFLAHLGTRIIWFTHDYHRRPSSGRMASHPCPAQCATPSLRITFRRVRKRIFRSKRNVLFRIYSESYSTFGEIGRSSLPLICAQPVTPRISSRTPRSVLPCAHGPLPQKRRPFILRLRYV